MRKKYFNITSTIIIFLLLFSSISPLIALEINYPGIDPEEAKTFEGFFVYIYKFIIIISGLIAFGILIWGGIKWLISEGSTGKIQEAKSQISSGFLGIAIILLVYLILSTINPQLSWVNISKERIKNIPITALLPSTQKSTKLVAIKIPLGQLADGSIIGEDYIPTVKPTDLYKEEDIDPALEKFIPLRDQIFKETGVSPNPGFSSKEDQEKFLEKLNEKIEKVSDKISEITSDTCEGASCNLSCSPLMPTGTGMVCKTFGITELSQKINQFKNRTNEEFNKIESELRKANEDVKNILNLENDEFSSYDINKFSKDFNEDYSNDGEKLVQEILDLAEKVKIEECCSSQSRVEEKIKELKEIANYFKNGYLIRKNLWETIKTSIVLKEELDKHRNLKDGENPDLNPVSSTYVHEGTITENKLNRILDVNNEIKKISNQITKTSLVMNVAAGTIMALTSTCNCFFCGCTLVAPCTGDPCLIVRPVIIAAQVILGTGAATLPALGTRLEKEIDKMEEEKEKLQESVELLTNGLIKAEFLLKTCTGQRGENQLNLLSLPSFLIYKSELEKYGYEIDINNPWPEIEDRGDIFTFYCIEGPLLSGLTEGSHPYSRSPFEGLNVKCESELEVGGLINNIKDIVRDEEKMLDQIDTSMDDSKKIINEISRTGSSKTDNAKIGDLLKNSLPSGLATKEIFMALDGESLKDLFLQKFESVAEKYAKDLNRHIIENLPGKELLEITQKTLKGMDGKDLKTFLSDYLGSLKNKEKKKIVQSIFESMDGLDIKKNLDEILSKINDTDAEKLWDQTIEKLEKKSKEEFFFNAFGKMQNSEILNFYNKIIELKDEDGDITRKILKEILEKTKTTIPNIILKDYIGSTIEERIKIIPNDKLKDIYLQAGEMISEAGGLKEAMQEIPENLLEKTIENLPAGKKKELTKILFNGLEESEIKDFLLYNVLEPDPGFFGRMTDFIPDENIQEIFLNKIIPSIGGDNLKNVLNNANYALVNDPRKVLDSLIFKYVPINQLETVAEKIENKLKGLDEFLGEAIEIMPKSAGLKEIKDAIDKVSPHLKDIKGTINSILNEIPLPKNNVANFINDILPELPEESLRKLAEGFLEEEVLPEADKVIKDIIGDIGLDRGRRAIKKLIKFVSERENDVKKSELLKDLQETIETLPDYQLPDNFEDLADEEKEKIITDALEEMPDYQLHDIIDNISDDIIKKITKDQRINEALKGVLENVPDSKIDISVQKIIDKNIKWSPESREKMKEKINKVINYLPKNTNEIMIELINKIDNNEKFKEITDQIFEKLPLESTQELMEKISNFMPSKLLDEYMNKLISKASEEISKIFDDIQESLPDINLEGVPLADVFTSIFSGSPGLKENALEMIKQPWKFRCMGTLCACSGFFPPFCVGFPALPTTYVEISKRLSYITKNNVLINLNQESVNNSVAKTDNIINNDIKGDIYGALRVNRFNLYEKFPSIEKNVPLYNQWMLFKCEDAMRYGWVDTCKDKFNFRYCTIVE